jgi:hypothetical protein
MITHGVVEIIVGEITFFDTNWSCMLFKVSFGSMLLSQLGGVIVSVVPEILAVQL